MDLVGSGEWGRLCHQLHNLDTPDLPIQLPYIKERYEVGLMLPILSETT